LLDNVLLFAERCRELDCLERPYPFASDHSRFSYFRTHGRDPAYPAYDDTRCEALLMSGLPAAGKDHWIAANLPNVPVISLDDIRRELSISPTDPQGAVVAVARERARANLRVGRSFVWNGTNVSRDLRARVVRLLADYNARVRIVYVEVSEPRLLHQNRQRRDPIPEQIIEKLLGRWQVPDLSEAHQVEWVVADSELGEIMADHAQRGQ
jgi:predicted kinase